MINESELIIWSFTQIFISGICQWLLEKKAVKFAFSDNCKTLWKQTFFFSVMAEKNTYSPAQ